MWIIKLLVLGIVAVSLTSCMPVRPVRTTREIRLLRQQRDDATKALGHDDVGGDVTYQENEPWRLDFDYWLQDFEPSSLELKVSLYTCTYIHVYYIKQYPNKSNSFLKATAAHSS